MKRRWNKWRKGERGQVLLLVMILMLLGGLIITPLLSYMSTGLTAGMVFENKADKLYAADSGVEDGLWQIKNDTTHDPYDYYNLNWNYDLAEKVNDKNVSVNITNVWIPKGLTPPDKTNAKQIIEGSSPKIIVTGVVSLPLTYKINIDYYPTVGETFTVSTLGVWLPPGFTYVPGSSNLGTEPANSTWCSGQAVVWSFSPAVDFSSLPGVNPLDSPIRATITFQFSAAQSGQSPAAVSWINTSLNLSGGYTYAWDADKKVYHITSTADDTTVDAYAMKLEIRKLGSAIASDCEYYAAGNSLMRDTNGDGYYRETLVSESSANVTSIPQNAQIAAAYLYWSAWRNENAKQSVFSDSCSSSNFSWWVNGGDWAYNSGSYRACHTSGSDTLRYLTHSQDLSTYGTATVTLSWQWWSNSIDVNKGLDVYISADGSNFVLIDGFRNTKTSEQRSYIIPSTYLTSNFQVRFSVVGSSYSSNRYCYIDDITIIARSPDTSVIFKINNTTVYFDANGDPQQGTTQEITASKSQVLPNYSGSTPNGFSYSCYKDVTKLVQTYSNKAPDPATNHPGNALYTVGNVAADTRGSDGQLNEWGYAGWSLVIIYQSPDTLGHQLYLYDKFIYSGMDQDIDFDGDGQPGGTISGFLVPERVGNEANAARLTAFVGEGDQVYSGDYFKFNNVALSDGYSTSNVWNSRSLGMTADGVDVDTFNVTWTSNLLQPGDTSAQIDLPTQTDSWNLVYIILSFRSSTTTGGTLSYLIRG